MSYKAITIYTPSGSAPHIAAEDDAFIYDSVLGGKSGILGSLSCVKLNNNTVVLSGGGVSNRGFIMYIPNGGTHSIAVENGTQGLERHDLVVAEFTRKGGEYADEHVLKVIKGTPGSNPTDPQLTHSQLVSANDVNQLALFRIVINGLEITNIVQLAENVGYNEKSAQCTGNAATAAELQNARTITLSGDASGSVSFNGSQNVTINTTVNSVQGRRIFVQEAQPQSPNEGDLWFW